jgi:hypothetical protein
MRILAITKKSFSSKAALYFQNSKARLANVTQELIVKTPSMGESITEGTLTSWMKSKGEKKW